MSSQIYVTGSQVRMARAALKLSVRDLAASAGVSPTTVTRVESDLPVYTGTLEVIGAALEKAGIEFIPAGNGGVGVRLKD